MTWQGLIVSVILFLALMVSECRGRETIDENDRLRALLDPTGPIAARARRERAEDEIDRAIPGFTAAYEKQALPWWRRWPSAIRRAWRRFR